MNSYPGIILSALAISVAAFWLAGCIGAGPTSEISKPKGESDFPEIRGVDINGKTVQMPDAFEGELYLVAAAFEREQQNDVNTWIKAARRWEEEYPGFHFYELPVIYKMNVFGRMFLNNAMSSGIKDPKQRETTFTVYLDKEEFREQMNMPDEKEIYVILFNADNKELWRTRGRINEDAKAELIETIESRLGDE